MPDLSELTRLRPDRDGLPGLDLPGLHRRARRRDRLRVAATTTLAIVVLGAGVVGIDRLVWPGGVSGVEIGPIGPGVATDSSPSPDQEDQGQESAPSLEDMEAALRDTLMHRIALWDRTAQELVDRLQQASEVLVEEDRADDPVAIERRVIGSILVPAHVERLQRELQDLERALLRDRLKLAALDGVQPPGVLEDVAWHGPSGDPISPQRLDVVRGTDHCDHQDILFLHLEWPFDATTGSASFRQYVRDPAGTLDAQVGQSLDVDATLPTWAMPTGHHTSLAYLWLGPGQGQDAVYLVHVDHVERWPRADPPVLCW